MLAAYAGCIMLLAGVFAWLMHFAATTADGRIGGPFRLLADDGRVVTERSFAGKYLAIYFGYTACQDVCPDTLSALVGALHSLGSSAAIQPVFITVDPQHDTPAVLQRYVGAFSPNLLGLTGTDAALRPVFSEFHVAATARAAGQRGELRVVDHSSVIYIMAPDGRFLGPVAADSGEQAMSQAIARYLHHES